jgi:hypothetical protein
MSDNDIHGIEKGWHVHTADGHDIGTVEETTDTYILVKSGLINTTQRYLPAALLAHVRPEKNEIAISATQQVIEEGDWSAPPLEGPRRDGAPINDEAYDEERDPVAAGIVRDPERPTNI